MASFDRIAVPRRETHESRIGFRAATALAVSSLLALVSPSANAEDLASWQVVGTQGLLQVVIVPKERAQDASAYQAQIAKLCPPERTCFINFYTNSTGVAPQLPLPDAIEAEATARFRRSMKNGAELLQWSCRLRSSDGQCF
ncbi:MAG: hypothetical protein IV094_23395 [Vitreoscilla sp.]|nr:hypothetical protein [Vitreoscilla sp.]